MPDNNHSTIGSRLKYIRCLLGLSRQELANSHFIPPNRVRAWENKDSISAKELVEYMQMFKNHYGYSMSFDKLLNLDCSSPFMLPAKTAKALRKQQGLTDARALIGRDHHFSDSNYGN